MNKKQTAIVANTELPIAAKVRQLFNNGEGMSKSAISKELGIRYQHVFNVIERGAPKGKSRAAKAKSPAEVSLNPGESATYNGHDVARTNAGRYTIVVGSKKKTMGKAKIEEIVNA